VRLKKAVYRILVGSRKYEFTNKIKIFILDFFRFSLSNEMRYALVNSFSDAVLKYILLRSLYVDK